MKKKFLIGFVLLSVSLFFWGCPTEADDDPPPAPTPEELAAELADSFGAAAAVDPNDATRVVFSSNFTVDEPVSVPAGVTLAVLSGNTLTVPAGKTLNVAGTLDVAETLTVSGTLNNSGSIEVSGKYIVATGGTGTNNGTITIQSGGVSIGTDDNSIGGTGSVVVEAGGKAYFSVTDTNNPSTGTYFIGESGATFQLASGSFSFNNTSYVLDGEARLDGEGSTKKWTVDAAQQLTLAADSTLYISTGVVLSPNDTAGKKAVVGNTGAKIIFKDTAQLWYTARTGEATNTTNFYDDGATFESGWKYTASGDTTYNWDANADGSGTAGWKKATE